MSKTNIQRNNGPTIERATVERDTSRYPLADASFLTTINLGLLPITLESGRVIPPLNAQTTIQISNFDLFGAFVEWSNGKARIGLTIPTPQAGESLFIWHSGQTFVNAMPTTYDYEPGDAETLYVVVGANASAREAPYNKKCTVHISFGIPPSL